MTDRCEGPVEDTVAKTFETDDKSVSGTAPSSKVAEEEAVQEVNNIVECKQDPVEQTTDTDRDFLSPVLPETSPKKGLKRNVSFPEESCVKNYLEPPDPAAYRKAKKWTCVELIQMYKYGCEKNGAKPLTKVLQQLQGIENTGERYSILSLKGEKLDMKICESLEEIFKLVQFRCVDLEASHLDDETAVALFDMIEYYESANKVNISFNKNISGRGWQACSRMIRKTPGLTFLDIRNCDCNERVIPLLGRALRMGCFLTTLHMENSNISGRALVVLVAALKMNELLKELFLADNKLMPTDGIQLGNLLKYNHHLQLLDLRNNTLQDIGVGHICDGLYEQNLDSGLITLVLWNNQISYQAMAAVGKALSQAEYLETLNLGHNNITNEGIHLLKDGLLVSKSLLRLGLQATKISCEGAVALAEAIADSHRLLRVDLRENDIKTAGLMALSLALKVNETVSRMDLDRDTKRESGVKDYADQQRRLQEDISKYLDRNRDSAKRKAKEAESKQANKQNEEVETKVVDITQNDVENTLFEKSQRPGLLFIPDHTLEETLDSPHVCPVIPLSNSPMVAIPTISTSPPPAEVILSPQYVPQVRKKKLFTVSKVEIQSLISPTAMSVLPSTSNIVLSPTFSDLNVSDGAVLPSSSFSEPNVGQFQLLLSQTNTVNEMNGEKELREENTTESGNTASSNMKSDLDSVLHNAHGGLAISSELSKCNTEINRTSDYAAKRKSVEEFETNMEICDQSNLRNDQLEHNDKSCCKTDQSNSLCDTQVYGDVNSMEISVVTSESLLNKNNSRNDDSGVGTYDTEQWTHVNPTLSPNLCSGQEEVRTNPNFQTSMTLNGMTQEIASALDSIESDKCQTPSLAYDNLSTPDDFERELDAMLVSVTQATNIPQIPSQGPAQIQDSS